MRLVTIYLSYAPSPDRGYPVSQTLFLPFVTARMAGILSPADAGGVVDVRTGSVSGDIGTSHDPIISEIAAPDTHGHNTIYLDSSISFENYHWWANRSREAEKLITTDAGLKQIWKVMIGKTIRKENSPPVRIVDDDAHNNESTALPEKMAGEKVHDDSSSKEAHDSRAAAAKRDEWGVTEKEWEIANRATRTATVSTLLHTVIPEIIRTLAHYT